MTTLHQTAPVSTRDFLRRLWQLALPISLQNMMFSTLGLIDVFMVSLLSETAVAAVGMGNRIFFINIILSAAMGSGMSVLAAQYVGAENRDGVRRVLVQTVLAAVAINLPFVLYYMLSPAQVMQFASDDASLIELGSTYIFITAPSFLFVAITIPLEALLRTNNEAKVSTNIGMVAIALNILFNYLLIYGKFGFPELGVAGSAWGTTLSRIIQTFILIYYLFKVRPQLKPTWMDVLACKAKKPWIKFSSICVPMMIQDGMWAFGLVMYSILFARMGVAELAVMSAISSIESVMISFFIGFAIAASILLGKELGAQRFDEAWKQSRFILLIAPLLALVVGTVTWLFNEQIISLFGQFDANTVEMGLQILVIAGFAQCIRVINLTGVVGILRSGGDVKATAVINFIGMWFVGVPLTWAAVTIWHLPLWLVFICSLMEEVAKAILVLIRFGSKHWLKNLTND